MRIIVEKINRVVRKRQRMIAQALRRIHGYAIAKAIKLGLLPWSPEWWKWEYALPAQITADKRYDSDVDTQEYENRFTTLKAVCGKRGTYWTDTQDQWLYEMKRLQDRAKEIGVDLTQIPQASKSAAPILVQQGD